MFEFKLACTRDQMLDIIWDRYQECKNSLSLQSWKCKEYFRSRSPEAGTGLCTFVIDSLDEKEVLKEVKFFISNLKNSIPDIDLVQHELVLSKRVTIPFGYAEKLNPDEPVAEEVVSAEEGKPGQTKETSKTQELQDEFEALKQRIQELAGTRKRVTIEFYGRPTSFPYQFRVKQADEEGFTVESGRRGTKEISYGNREEWELSKDAAIKYSEQNGAFVIGEVEINF